MPKTRPPYPAEFRQQMVELMRAGRSAEELTFSLSAQSRENSLSAWTCLRGEGQTPLTEDVEAAFNASRERIRDQNYALDQEIKKLQ